eukprot:CAMPEP_0194551458 /NCGR_PEP_ID=MMETSP0253-20130528/96231_1 /TAXON_ID=2966 /ORGANISM="Noctiluca scintillans" /LENGTH=1443 /DNA_ID=CAMNT_0039398917 /DNA_START=47 /DNA_END=4378 /DNA_ORIENTATION=+
MVYNPVSGSEEERELLEQGEVEEEEDHEDDDDDSDEDSGGEYDLEDENIGQDWKSELALVDEPAINEAMLHKVPWNQVGIEFSVNLFVTVLFFGFHLVIRSNTLVELPIFIVGALIVVIAWELAVEAGSLCQVIYVLWAVVLPIALAFGIDSGSTFPLTKMLPILVFFFLFTSSLVWCIFQCTNWSDSECWNALTGTKKLWLERKLDLVKLARSMTLIKLDQLKQQAGILGWLSRKRSDKNRIVLGMVTIDPDPNVSNVTLKIDDEEVPDGDYRLVELVEEGSSDGLDLNDLQKVLKRKIQITDRIIDEWVAHPSSPDEEPPEMLAGTSDEQKRLRKWFWTRRLAPAELPCTLVATVQAIDRVKALFGHWLFRAFMCCAITAVLSLPSRFYLEYVFNLHDQLCGSGGALVLPGGETLCTGKACDDTCGNLYTFLEGVNETLHTSHVEYLFICILLPVFVFVYSVSSVEREQKELAHKFLARLPENKAAIQEVHDARRSLETLLTTDALANRFLSRFKAWSPFHDGDPDLAACGLISAAEFRGENFGQSENGALKIVMDGVSSMSSQLTVDMRALTYGVRVDPNEDLAELEEEKADLVSEWTSLKTLNNLGAHSSRNFKAVFSVTCQGEGSWKMWKAWFDDPSGYKTQLDHIIKNDRAQDSGVGCHLTETVVIGDQGIPKGFSLTHMIAVSPDDGSKFQIEVGGGGENFKKEIDVMEKMLLAPTEVEANEGRRVTLNDRLEEEGITLRFSLSEQYYSNMRQEEKDRLLDGKNAKCHADFVGIMLEPVVRSEDEACNENGGDITTSELMVVLGEGDPLKPMLQIFFVLIWRVLVFVLCFFFMMIVPCWRVIGQGGHLFPAPFTITLMLNTLFASCGLWLFLSAFQNVTERLALMSSCLRTFEQKTINPSGKSAVTKKAKGGSKKKEKKEVDKGQEQSPFDLVILEARNQSYVPGNSYWDNQWKTTQNNVKKWHFCAGYLRVFVTASRLTAQTILLAAAVILAFLLVLSLVQVIQGKGAVNVEELTDVAGDAEDSGRMLAERAATTIQSARGLASTLALAGGGNCSAADLFKASKSLKNALQPFRDSLHGFAEHQHRVFTGVSRRLGVAESAADHLSRITKTQLLTVAMVLLLLFYSVPLIFHIAMINQYFERHANLLLSQKEVHRLNQSRREIASDGGQATKKTDLDGDEDEEKPDEEEEKDECGDEGGDGDADGGKKEDGIPRDFACKRYEKMLDMAMQSASKNKTRFPLKLFGFVINSAVLGGWIALAASPLVKQAQVMGPSVVKMGCVWLEEHALEQQMEDTSKKLHKDSKLKLFFRNVVCKRLEGMVSKIGGEDDDRRLQLDEHLGWIGGLDGSANPEPFVEEALELWWSTYSCDPSVKLVLALHLLEEIDQDAQKKLVAVPSVVKHAYDEAGLEASLWVLRAQMATQRSGFPASQRSVIV